MQPHSHHIGKTTNEAAFIERHGGRRFSIGRCRSLASPGESVSISSPPSSMVRWKCVKVKLPVSLLIFPNILETGISPKIFPQSAWLGTFRVANALIRLLERRPGGRLCRDDRDQGTIVAKQPTACPMSDAARLAAGRLTAICTVEDALKPEAGETIFPGCRACRPVFAILWRNI